MKTPVSKSQSLPDGFYLLQKEGDTEVCIVKLYTPIEPSYRGIGFGVWDGGGFMPISEFDEDSFLVPAQVEWFPIHTAPRDGSFIAWLGNDDLPIATIFHAKTYWDSVAEGAPRYFPIEDAKRATHWKPLPAPPSNA